MKFHPYNLSNYIYMVKHQEKIQQLISWVPINITRASLEKTYF